MQELDTVVLARDLDEYGLKEKDIGTIVHVYEGGHAFEVEFVAGEGLTVAVVTLPIDAIRPMQRGEILHARGLAA